MSSFGQLMLSLSASVLWIAALSGVIVFHCLHLSRGCTDCRLLHWAHILMLLGMICMFVEMAFGASVAPGRLFFVFYVSTSVGVFAWITMRLLQHEPVQVVWLLALMQQVAMIYMWTPMDDWTPAISYGFAIYFTMETMIWTIKAARLGWVGDRLLAGIAASQTDMPSISNVEDLCMAIMAASMAYMFLGMQLVMTAPHVTEQAENIVSSSTEAGSSNPTGEHSSSQKELGAQQTSPQTSTPASNTPASQYVIRRGDTFRGIAARLYHDPQHWSRLSKANPGVDPRHLTIGRKIDLPKPVIEP
jgi:LysM repeat protein